MLKDSFYQINHFQNDENSIRAELTINAGHTIFDGHFPGNPVTPGVVQMELVKELLSEAYGGKVNMETMGTCKFLAILNPVVSPEILVEITIKTVEQKGLKISAVITGNEHKFFKMNGSYSIL